MKKKTAQQVALVMRAVARKAALAALLVLLTLPLVTCEDFLMGFNPKEDEIVYTDWEYIVNPDGTGQMTVYLDGSKPVAYTKSQQRALNLKLADMSHDYFEAVFVNGTTVARAAWELGYDAGIRGVPRGVVGTGINYKDVVPAAAGDPAAVIFVGKKTGKTLLGVGHIIEVNKSPSTILLSTSTSVTFGVYALTTEIAIDDDNGQAVAGSSFWTATTSTTHTEPVLPPGTPADGLWAGATAATTLGSNTTLKGGRSFPIFRLPVPPTAGKTNVEAKYIIKGLELNATPDNPPYNAVPKPSLGASIFIYQSLEVLKRWPAYIVQGQTYDATEAVVDTFTDVSPAAITHATLKGNQVAANASPLDPYPPATPVPFETTFDIIFTQVPESDGIFSWTFQCPVFAITSANSTNGAPNYEKWYIRPGFGPYQYVLDDGLSAGGAVLMGTNITDLDWLEIFTVGVGFGN